jgi:transposase
LHRFLLSSGIANQVVDSASIEVNRRAEQAKTDHLDLGKLLTMLTPALAADARVRCHAGEEKVWSVVHVPSPAGMDQAGRTETTSRRAKGRRGSDQPIVL